MPRAMSAEELTMLFSADAKVSVEAKANLADAIADAKAACGAGEIVLICGSLYLAEQVIHLTEKGI